MVEDFLYICDGAYSQRELIRMEMNVLKVVNFDLGIPLSYRFLRRYARVSNSMLSIYLKKYLVNINFFYYYLCIFYSAEICILIHLKTVCQGVHAHVNSGAIHIRVLADGLLDDHVQR